MDTGDGTFKRFDELEKSMLERLLAVKEKNSHIFFEGEVVQVKGSIFKVRKITKKDIILRLLPWEKEEEKE